MYSTAIKIRSEIKAIPSLSNIRDISENLAAKMVPDSLYLLFQLILNGEDANQDTIEEHEKQADNNSINRAFFSIGQDVVFQASKRRKSTPKHVGIALAVHQAARSKSNVQMLHAAGHCISYDVLQRIDTGLAQEQIERFQANDNTPIPENLVNGQFLQFAADNIDILEETLDGKGTFHATQMAVFQYGPPKQLTPKEVSSTIKRDRALREIPPELNEILVAPLICFPSSSNF